MSSIRRKLLLSTALLIGAACLGQTACRAVRPAPPSTLSAAWRCERVTAWPQGWAQDAWVGEDLCLVCHPDAFEELESTPHTALLNGEDGWGCEACHGPGSAHEQSESPADIQRFLDTDPARVAGICARCHFEELRMLDVAGTHAGAEELACVTCHQIHSQRERAATSLTCLNCHGDELAAGRNKHHKALTRRGDHESCATCHGDGAQHLSSLGAAGTIAIPDETAIEESCADCHADDHAGTSWRRSAHNRAGLSCLDCHEAVWSPSESPVQREHELCAECHSQAVADFRLPNHHPVLEGGMDCSSCHDVHSERSSTFSARKLDRRCEECHRDTQGPFLYEHEADRSTGCGACHAPHGSPNRRLLLMTPVRRLCLSCHPSTPLSHNQAGFSPFRECTSCHTEIHGSNLHSKLFR